MAHVRGRMVLTIRDAATGRIKRRVTADNIACIAGEALVAALLDGETTFGGVAIPTGANWIAQMYGAVGTASPTPTVNDTQLGTELQRVQCAVNSRSINLVVLTFFFTTSQANGTITEGGVFLMGSATANSGYMLDHALLPSTIKNSSETATLQVQFTLQ